VKLRMSLTAVLAVTALGLAVVQFARPDGPRGYFSSFGLLMLIALLLGGRYAAQRQAQKRGEILKNVPRRPLGLSDESPHQ
jgi:hypothetical protein